MDIEYQVSCKKVRDKNKRKIVEMPVMADAMFARCLEMIQVWNTQTKKVPCLSSLRIPGANTPISQIFVDTLKVHRKFLSGSLVSSSEFVHPWEINVEDRKYTVQEYKLGLAAFLLKLPQLYYFHKRKLTACEFLCGGKGYSHMPSPFFTYYIPQFQGRDTEEMCIMGDRWLLLVGAEELSINDKKNFSEYVKWALPYFRDQWNGYNSLHSSFATPLEVLDFLTFGTLRRFKAKGKTVSSNILNQDFFKGLIEEFRISHGYTV